MRSKGWLLLLSLVLVGLVFLLSGLLRKLEKDQLFLLEQSMLKTAQALAPQLAAPLSKEPLSPEQRKTLQRALETTQNATGSRIRVLSGKRNLLLDSLSEEPDPQEQLRFRPEIQSAFTGHYGAYTRFSDETRRSLALFVAVPIYSGDSVTGCVYVSHSTDDILQQLGIVRRAARGLVAVLTLVTFIGTLAVTGQLRRTLDRLRALTSGIKTVESTDINLEGDDQVAQIGQNFNRLVANLRKKVSELQEERAKTKRFLEEVAHELKTPITGLAGSLEALRTPTLDVGDRQRLLENVEKETNRLSELTSRLLELQKLEYDALKEEPFDLVSVAETVIDTYEGAARRKAVELVLAEVDNLAVRGDAAKIQRVLENLVDNAIRCTPEKKRVAIGFLIRDSEALVTVADEGPGPPSPELFSRNAQGERFQGSLGLGLALASEIVERHGGTLTVEPREGGGSVFSFALPRVTQN